MLNMRPYKDPDEFIKNLGPEAFRQRIAEARNSFLFEIDTIRQQYSMEDPEQKTAFYNETARKLLEFPEALERDNYIQAVAREYFINYEDLKRLVNQMGSRYGTALPGTQAARETGISGEIYGEKPKTFQKKKDREEGIRQSERLLLTWLIEDPRLFDKIQGIIGPEDFVKPLYRRAAQMVFEGHENGEVSPAAILNHFIDDEGNYKEVAALFNASLNDSLSNEEQKKAFADTVMKVKKSSLDYQSRTASDLNELQRIIREQAELANMHISLD